MRRAPRGRNHSLVRQQVCPLCGVRGEWLTSSYRSGLARHACVTNACAVTSARQVHLPAQRVLDAGACHPREYWTGTPVPLQVVSL